MQRIEKMPTSDTEADLAWQVVAAEDQVVRVLTAAKALAAKIERIERDSYRRGLEAGFASGFAAATAEAREPRRREVERDEDGRVVAISG